MIAAVAAELAIVLAVPQALLEIIDARGSIFVLSGRRVSEALLISVLVRTKLIRIVGLLMIVAVAAMLTIVLPVSRTLLEGIDNNGSIFLPNGYQVLEALFVAVSVDPAVVRVVGFLMVPAVAAELAIVLAVPHALLKVVNAFPSTVLFNVGCVLEALFVAVSVRTSVVQIAGLPMIASIAAILAIVLAVLHPLLEGPSFSALLVVAIWILVPILILALALVLLCGNCGAHAGRAEPGEGDSKCQHP